MATEMKYGAISIDSEKLNGTPLFNETNIPVHSFFEHLEAGKPMEKFVDDFPAVDLKDTVEVLQMAKVLLTTEKILKDNFEGNE